VQDLEGIPAREAPDLGTGVPTRYAELRLGDSVLDLGSGAGLDAFVAARAVGPAGRVVGIDLTPEMVERARRAARRADADGNVEFRVGSMERLPFPDETFDVVLSNCAINLSPEKARVFREAFRVLKPGGRLSLDDVVQERRLAPSEVEGVGCLATAALRRNYLTSVRKAGFRRVRVLADRPYWTRAGRVLASAIAVRADKPRQGRRSGRGRGGQVDVRNSRSLRSRAAKTDGL
jgi:SAM-dependent methyltransferase